MIVSFLSEAGHVFVVQAFSLIWNDRGEVRLFHEPGHQDDTGQVLVRVKDGKSAERVVESIFIHIADHPFVDGSTCALRVPVLVHQDEWPHANEDETTHP